MFQDITLEACRSRGILGSNIKNLTLNYMEIRNTGNFIVGDDIKF